MTSPKVGGTGPEGDGRVNAMAPISDEMVRL
jgi:hypothetical protein